jgi:hypothetical protein
MTRGYDRDLFALGITLLNPIEKCTNRRRSPSRLPSRFSDQPPDDWCALSRNVSEAILFAGLILSRN